MKFSKYLLGVVAAATLFFSCNDRDLKELTHQAYIAQTSTQAGRLGSLRLTEENVSKAVNVRLSAPQAKDETYKLELSQEALDEYNKLHGTSYVMLPADQLIFPTSQVVIKAGEVVSDPLTFTVKPLSQELSESGKKFAVAFKLKGVNASSSLLKGADTYIYRIRPLISTKAPILGTYQGAYYFARAEGVTPVALDRFTVEMRVNINGFKKNNQALFGWFEQVKNEGSEIYMRFGDATAPFNYLNIKFGKGGQIDRTFEEAKPDTWYHVAIVYDGAQATLYVNGEKIESTDKPAGRVFSLTDVIHIAASGPEWFQNACIFSEIRVWNKTRTQAQLRDDEFDVDPSTPGLLHYWMMNEGEGDVCKNAVKGGPSLQIYKLSDIISGREQAEQITMEAKKQKAAPVWLSDIRSDGKGTTKVPNN